MKTWARMILGMFLLFFASSAEAVKVSDICRIKGQEENTLQGLGLVVGLRGTGDSAEFGPTARALANAMQRLGTPLPGGLQEFRKANNVAIVMVTATVPATGARQGDKLDCVVTSVGAAKSLAGGTLLITPLRGPFFEQTPLHVAGQAKVYAFAQGALHLEEPQVPTKAVISQGCRLEEDFLNNGYVVEGGITLVLKESHAQFSMAFEVADRINHSPVAIGTQSGRFRLSQDATSEENSGALAVAIDSVNILVRVPSQYLEAPVDFIAQVMDVDLEDVRLAARVDIDQAAGSIVVGEDVEIGPSVISHRNLVIQTGNNLPPGQFVPTDPENVKLKALMEALNAVKVPTEDMIEIIKGLERNGKLHGQLVIQ